MENSFTEKIKKSLFTKKKEYNFYDIWDYLMLAYGYIPKQVVLGITEEMDANDIDELIKRINSRIPIVPNKGRKK